MAFFLGITAFINIWTLTACQISLNLQLPTLHGNIVPEQQIHDVGNPDVISVILSKPESGDYVKVINPPDVIKQGTRLTIEYQCVTPFVAGIQLRAVSMTDRQVVVFHRWWPCGGEHKPLLQMLQVRLQDKLAYRPSLFNPMAIPVKSLEILAWIVDDPVLDSPKLDIFAQAEARFSKSIQLLKPFDRIGKPTRTCMDWWLSLLMHKTYTPQCSKEPEIFTLVEFPIALSGHWHGVHRQIPEFHNPTLRAQRKASFLHPRQTLSFWLYVVEYCPNGDKCSIFQRLTWNERYCTPLIYITDKGRIHVQAVAEYGDTTAFLTNPIFTIPKLKWCHLVIIIDGSRWTLEKECLGEAPTADISVNLTHVEFPWPVYYDANMSLSIVGGSEVAASFKGYVGEAKIYRNRIIPLSKLPKKDPYDRIFELGIDEWNTKCSRYLAWVNHIEYRAKLLLQETLRRKTCRDEIYDIFYPEQNYDVFSCNAFTGPIPKHYHLAYRIVRQLTIQGRPFKKLDISKRLMEYVTDVIEEKGLLGIHDIITLLKQASCYGNHDATFMLATVLNNGMGVKADENQAHKYLMFGAMEGNVLCQLSLGSKHMLGIDGVPLDYEQAYAYYKPVALKTRDERETHDNDGLYTEHVRLTDEEMVQAMTDEEGDVFHWLKHQSEQGVLSAQREMARMLYWGARGVNRNTDAAVDYYRMAADSDDPVSQYDFGIVLLKGHGVKPNITAAIELFEKAAKHNYHPALNVLGWYYLEHLRQYEKAKEYLEKAYALGNKDAAHNLGYMHLMGWYPGKGVDRVGAFKYYAFAAKQGQLDSGLSVAMYNMRGGHPAFRRNPPLAAEWGRFIAEQNVAIGKILRRGLKAYNNENWPAALVYYHMAAETGLETGQFNTAYLCDENDEGLVHYLEKECTWRFFNLSTHRELHQVNAYSLVKMGDYYWYGCQGNQDAYKAANYYKLAVLKHDPHAMFNLGFMLEEGAHIPREVWQQVDIEYSDEPTDILVQVYSKCMESYNTEAYLPCTLSLYRVQAEYIWRSYHTQVQLLSFCTGFILLVIACAWIASQMRSRAQVISSV